MDELTDFEKIVDSITMIAKTVRFYYISLIESGFSENNAMALTIQYQAEVFDMIKAANNKKQDTE